MRHRLTPRGGAKREDYESDEWCWVTDLNPENSQEEGDSDAS